VRKIENKTTRGVLNPQAIGQKFHLSRPTPSADLSSIIDHFWIVHWDLRGKPSYRSETLPFPAVHIAIEKRRPEVYGVVTQKFSRRLQSNGRVFGVKFRPGAFYPFFGAPVSRLTDRIVSLRSIFGPEGSSLRGAILAESNESSCVDIFESFLRARIPEEDRFCDRIRDIVEQVAADRTIVRAEQIASLLGVSLRTSQMAFKKYIGVTPKWVIQRYRLHEAAEQLTSGSLLLADLSSQLGYFDQSHFIRDFKAVVGCSPAKYAAQTRIAAFSS
jgi:AraC-like DNA-binding protein